MIIFRKILNKEAILVIIAVVIFLVWYIHKKKPFDPRMESMTVQSEVALQRDIPEVISMSGFVTPKNTVDIRAQVTALVKSVNVQEGQTVKAGQLLLTLDDRGAGADAGKLAALVVKDQALLDDARHTLIRNQELRSKGFVAQSMVDSAQSAVDAALATLNADRAGLVAGKVAVDYYQLTAPISGRVGEINVHIGSLVQPSATQLITTITQIDPIDVVFNVPEKNVQQLLAAQRNGAVAVTAKIDKENAEGRLTFVDNTIDATTGNLKAKALFNNKNALLWPGGLVDITLTLQILKNAVTVSPRSIQVGPDGKFVYLIAEDKKVSTQPVSVEYLTSELAVVNGLAAGSHIVLEGGQNLRAGMSVSETNAEHL